jgi:hypothetical protein
MHVRQLNQQFDQETLKPVDDFKKRSDNWSDNRKNLPTVNNVIEKDHVNERYCKRIFISTQKSPNWLRNIINEN